MSRFNRYWVAAWTIVLVAAGTLEATGFVLETFFRIKQFPTLSSILVTLFGVNPLVIATVIIGFLLAIHWSWVSRQLRLIARRVKQFKNR